MIVCRVCGHEASDNAAFCSGCGTRIAAAPPVAEERKTVTTLFCDLVAFTAMSEAADPEDVDAVLRVYHAAARRAIESHGGTLEKFIGDAVVGVFGVPAAREDDAERAVRAGLRILETLAVSGLARPDGTPLLARCGVNTGETLVRLDVTPGSGEGFVTGDAVNTAARLEAAAQPGAVLVGALTRQLTEHVILYESLPPVAAKGKTEPVPAWRALQPAARTGLRTSGLATTRFLGRAAELSSLQDELGRVSATGACRVALLVGEPGIGKSRLVLEFARCLDERPELVTWRQGRCPPYGEGVAFWALGEIVKEQAGIRDSDDVATVEAKLEALVLEDAEGAWLRRRLRPLLALDASQASREENFAAWSRFLELVATPGPAVLVFEDLHWAGEGMLAFVEHLLSRGIDAPLLVVATTRPELLERHEEMLASATRRDRLRRITLPALSGTETGDLVADLLGADLAPELGPRIVGLAGGNPLFAEQFARLLREGGPSGPLGARGRRLVEDPDLLLPDTVHAVIAARLDALPPEHKAMLCDAAVLGETFWRGGVAAISGRDDGPVGEVLAALAARDFVRPVVTPTIEGEAEYLFWHILARDVAYGQLPRRVRARKHRAAADWLEVMAGERVDEFAEVLAHHYSTALELARSAGDAEQAGSLVEPAISALRRAGQTALRLDAAAAERHFAAALELVGPDARERLRILPDYGKALLVRNRYREAAAAYKEAITGLEAADEIRSAALARCWLGNVLLGLNEPAAEVMQASVDTLADDGPSSELAEVLGHYALSLLIQDEDPRCVLEAADRAIETSRLLGLPEPAVPLSCRGGALLALGDSTGLEDIDRASAATREQGLGIERATLELNRSSLVFAVRGAVAEQAALHEVYDFVRRCGMEVHVTSCRAALTDSSIKTGDWDEALSQVALLVPELEEAEDVWNLLYVRALQALVYARRGEPGQADPFLGWLMDQSSASEIGWARDYGLVAASAVHLSAGRRQSAMDLLEACFAAPRACGSIVEIAPEAVRTALGGGGHALAARILRHMESLLPEPRLPLERHVTTSMRALVRERRGEHDAAAADFAGAAAGWSDFGMPGEAAHALLGQGRCLVALGRAPGAAAPLAAAHEIFARLGARPALEETDAALAAIRL